MKQIYNTVEPFVIDICSFSEEKTRMTRRTINIISSWENQKAVLRDKFKKLTDADLDFEESRKNEMLSKLALKLGMTTREILLIIKQGLYTKQS